MKCLVLCTSIFFLAFGAVFNVLADAPAFLVVPGKNRRVAIEFDSQRDLGMIERLHQGLEVRYRFFANVCKARIAWIDHCFKEVEFINKIRFDPVTESYSVSRDQIGDGKRELLSKQLTIGAAVGLLSSLNDVDLGAIVPRSRQQEIFTSKRSYLELRLEASSHGETRSVLETVSYLMTLGLIDIRHYDSGKQVVYLTQLYSGADKW